VIGLVFALAGLTILLVAITIAAWQVGGLFLLSAVVAALIWALVSRSSDKPGDRFPESAPEPEPQWQPRPKARDPHNP
jgi:membrane protein implicated in regulation of membrane protease activity